MMQGHGYFKQSSGYEYEGLFENGQPANMACKLQISVEEAQQHLEIYEGVNFKLQVMVLNDKNEIFMG